MSKYSLTYVAAIVSIVTSLSVIFGFDVDKGALTELAQGLVTLVSGAVALYGRYRVGDLKITGVRRH